MDRFFTTFKTSGQALSIQRKRVQIASENLANANTTKTESGGPYRPKSLQLTQPDEGAFQNVLRTRLNASGTTDGHLSDTGTSRLNHTQVNLAPNAHVVSEARFRYEYDPGHPDADENGMVQYPDVDLAEEMTRLIRANRLYEANLSVIEAEKEIIKRSFEI